jgi:hypothetical protein
VAAKGTDMPAAHRQHQQRLSQLCAHLCPTASLQNQAAGGAGAAVCTAAASSGGGEQEPALSELDVFDRDKLAEFDEEKWLEDGYWAWPGVMTDSCRVRFSESLRSLQATQDYIIHNTDWDTLDWESHGLPSPPNKTTPEMLAQWAGGSESSVRGFPAGYGRGLDLNLPLVTPPGVANHGFFPEHFPLAYDNWLMHFATLHPQMLALQHRLHGTGGDPATAPGPLKVDHTILLNRAAGENQLQRLLWRRSVLKTEHLPRQARDEVFPAQEHSNKTCLLAGSTGRTWHSHLYGMGDFQPPETPKQRAFDPDLPGDIPTTDITAGTGLKLVRTLCFPDGISEEETGGIVGMIPGSHCYKDPWPGTMHYSYTVQHCGALWYTVVHYAAALYSVHATVQQH